MKTAVVISKERQHFTATIDGKVISSSRDWNELRSRFASDRYDLKDTTEKCFACDRRVAHIEWVITSDHAQTVPVGPECYRKVKSLDKRGGYQPPLGGPKLFLIENRGTL